MHGGSALFAQQKRESPVDLRYPYIAQDEVTIKLAPGLSIENAPSDAKIPFQQFAIYGLSNKQTTDTYTQVREVIVGNAFYKTEEYPQLRDFFQKTSAQDQQQVVLRRAAAVTAVASPAGARH